MLSVPFVAVAGAGGLSDPNLSLEAEQAVPRTVVPLNVPDGGRLQNYVQNTRQWFVDLAGSSLYWRLFVGSGFATLLGAVTLLFLGPNPEQARKLAAESAISNLEFVDQEAPSNSNAPSRERRPSAIELTVGAHDGAEGPVRADFDDPFVDRNRVTANIQHAIHVSGEQSAVVQQVSAQRQKSSQAAWLSGTIEIDVDANQPMRDHERTRQSHR